MMWFNVFDRFVLNVEEKYGINVDTTLTGHKSNMASTKATEKVLDIIKLLFSLAGLDSLKVCNS